MVQMISLTDSKDVKLTQQPTKEIRSVSSNLDFLDLLLTDIKENSQEKEENKNDKENDSLVKIEDILNNDKELKSFIKSEDSNIKISLTLTTDFKAETIKEIKNILNSKIKQNNILLTKVEVKEFKKIDNLKELMNFANKKGLNISNIKIDTEKVIKKINQLKPNDKIDNNLLDKISEKKQEKLSTKEILKVQNNQIEKPIIEKKENHNKSIKKIDLKNNNSIIKNEKISLENILNNSTKQSNIKNNIKMEGIENKKDNKDVRFSKLSEIKNKEEIQENKKSFNQLLNINHQEKKIENKVINLNSLLNEPIKLKENGEEKLQKLETKTESQNLNLNNSQSLLNELKGKSFKAQETIKHFNQNLDEAIKNYKPPVSKINIELNPQNLGKVEVTIIQRGNNIQVHMNTDQSNVAMFQTHQAEFRQSLANIGFSNIDMSFNSNQSNQDKERKQNQAKKSYQDNDEKEIGEIEIQANYKYA